MNGEAISTYLSSIYYLISVALPHITMDELRKKGLRSYFSLKNLVDISELTVKTLFKLFDALILPVVSYGCQVWLPSTWMIRLALSKK